VTDIVEMVFLYKEMLKRESGYLEDGIGGPVVVKIAWMRFLLQISEWVVTIS